MTQLGKYQLIRRLASGGMAEVFLAKAAGPMGFEKTLVLKRILPHLAGNQAFVEMFLSEAKLVAQLNHPNIVQIFDFGEADGSYFLAMEYIDGPTLRGLIKRARLLDMSLPLALCARIVAAACEGLAFAHDFRDPATGEPLGIIHRDISPDNVLLSTQGAVKVVDFGIAKVAGQSPHTQPGVVKGKISYMPPEQLRSKPLDRRVDVYALGIVLYEMLTGRRPFDTTSDMGLMKAIVTGERVPAVSLREDLPVSLQQILERAMAKDREDRYPDCRAFQGDLERFILSMGEPIGAYQIAQLTMQLGGELSSGPFTPPSSTKSPSARPALGTAAEEKTSPEMTPGERAAPPLHTEPDVRPTEATTPEAAGLSGPTLPAIPRDTDPSQPTTQAEPPVEAPARGRLVLPILLLAMGLLGIGYVLATRPGATPETQPVEGGAAPGPLNAQAPLESAQVDAGPAQAEANLQPLPSEDEPPTDEAPPTDEEPAPEAPDAGTPPTSQATASQDTPGVKKSGTSPGSTKRRRKGSVEFRIRPYALVSFNGKLLGQSPLAPIEAPEGMHTVRVVNRDLGKDVTRSFEVKPGRLNIFKINLYEE